MSVKTLQAELAKLRRELRTLTAAKDKYLAGHKTKARTLTDTVDAKAAELAAAESVGQMSDAERQAIGVELAKSGGG
ncbi:MAG: hypothetical protein IIC53_14225 [Proteobacteria bacterium]|nr:hypothetical protein [Pseudomonadota bacterium]